MTYQNISCQICGKEMGVLTSSHLKAHQYTFDHYREKFPGAPLVSEAHKERLRARNEARTGIKVSQETKDKMSASRTGKAHSQETRNKIGAKHKGKVRTQEEIDKWRTSYQESLVRNGGGFATGPRSQDFKDRMSEVAKARPREQQLAHATKMQEARRGSKATPEQRENYRTGRVKFMLENPDKLGMKLFDTVPELEFEAELVKRGIDYQKQFHTSKPHYLYDFKIGNILIEIDGPYHYDRKLHDSDEDFQRRIETDAAKNLTAIRNNFQIYRIPVKQHLPDNWIDILTEQGCTFFQ